MRLGRLISFDAYRRWLHRRVKRLRLYGVQPRQPRELGISFVYASGPTVPDPVSDSLRATQSTAEGFLDTEVGPASEVDIAATAQACYSHHGVWPISFSYPRNSGIETGLERSQLVASIIPGKTYTYRDENAYLDEYRSSYFGITHKKGGWDCFRHLEIVYSGAIPLMHDACRIPQFDMIHYPKRALAEIYADFLQAPRTPSERLQSTLQMHFNQHLTAQAMASYLLKVAGLGEVRRVLFVDENLANGVDYLSLLTLIGLYQLADVEVTAMIQVPYIWDDWSGRNHDLYGRGFGYTRVLPAEKRLNRGILSVNQVKRGLRAGRYDAVVFGSIMRNQRLYAHLREDLQPEQAILINGEDLPCDSRSRNILSSTGSPTFVRSIG